MKLIAETAWHHEGNFSFMKNLISDIVNKTNADIVKMHITLDFDEYMDSSHELYKKLKSMLFHKDQWHELISMVKESGKELMLIPNDTTAIDFAARYNPQFIELHSVWLNVPHLQSQILKRFNPETKIVIGVGGCTLQEIDSVVKIFKNRKTILMFGFQNYPTKYEDVNLSKIKKIQSSYPDKLFGYADHTGWNEPNNELITLLVSSNNMDFVEKHVTNVLGQERIDFSAAISIEMFNSLSKNIKLLNQIKGNGLIELNDGEKSYSIYGPMKMAALINSDLNVGHIFSIKDISFKRTKKKNRFISS
jgi:N,N'-diacetyllegionaminate synthase